VWRVIVLHIVDILLLVGVLVVGLLGRLGCQ
jgi:hypothetical protein